MIYLQIYLLIGVIYTGYPLTKKWSRHLLLSGPTFETVFFLFTTSLVWPIGAWKIFQIQKDHKARLNVMRRMK